MIIATDACRHAIKARVSEQQRRHVDEQADYVGIERLLRYDDRRRENAGVRRTFAEAAVSLRTSNATAHAIGD